MSLESHPAPARELLGLDPADAPSTATTAPKAAPGTDDPMQQASRRIRDRLLPRSAPQVPGFHLAGGTSRSPGAPGATCWDGLALAEGREALLVLNVRGHGLPAGCVLAVVRSLLRVHAPRASDPAALLGLVNEALSVADLGTHRQLVECGIVVPMDDAVLWSGAGRPPAALLGREGTFTEFRAHGPPLGLMSGFRYSTERHRVKVGDVFFVLSEASDGLFKGAADLVATKAGKPVGQVVETIHRALDRSEAAAPETSVLYGRRA